MNTNLELYRIFCEVVKYKNISKTAENMYISQSAVTQSIQKLENQLGGKLFFRSKSGVELTSEGQNLYEYVKDSIETMKNAENLFSQYMNLDRGNIRIGGGRVLIEKFILPSLMKMIKEYPNIEVSISRNASEEAIKKVANGELDMAIFNLYNNNTIYSNLETHPIKHGDGKYVFLASKEYIEKNMIGKEFNIKNKNLILPKSKIVEKRFKEYCKENEIVDYHKYEVQESSILNKMVLNGCGIGFSIKDYIDDELLKNKDIVILKELEYDVDKICIVTLKKSMCNKTVLELMKRIDIE